MDIAEFQEKYHEEIINLVLDIQNNEGKINLSLEEQSDLIDICGTFMANGGNFWVALDHDKVIGTIGLAIKEKDCGIFKKFFVHSDWRNTKTGLALYETMLEHAKTRNLKCLILDTPSVAKEAQRFYERAGFKRITSSELPVRYEYPDRDSLLYILYL